MTMNKSHIPAAQKKVLIMLIDDHREAQGLFKEFESARSEGARKKIVDQACQALETHTRIEEECFYPFLRDCDPEMFGDLLNEALVEHGSAKDMIDQLRGMDPSDPMYSAVFTVLGEYTTHHITEEEDELFPKVIERKIELDELLAPMQDIKKAA